jgi:hypothetical protein
MSNVNLDSAYWLGLLVSVILPVLVGLVTTRVTSAGAKAVLLLALSTTNGFLVELGDHGADWSLGTAAVLSLVTFAIGVLTHFGLYKPVGIAARAQAAFAKAA